MFAHEFVRNAYLAGSFVALACGCVGWFVILRAHLFAGDALSHIAFVGAIAAAALGVDERIGLFALTLAMAGGMAALGTRDAADDAVIGATFAWILGIGILLITLLATSSAGGSGTTTVNTLFGSIYSLSAGAAQLAAAIAGAVVVAVGASFRPLLFATLDTELAAARGLPVGLIGAGLLAVLAIVTAEATQAVGALLLLGLLAAPAGAAHQLTSAPRAGFVLSGALALASMWIGLALAYAVPSVPPSSAVIGVAAAAYLIAAAISRFPTRR